MSAQTFELRLTGFEFPAALPNANANFRIVADVRYVNVDGMFTTDHVVMPGLETFWECARDKSSEPNYVRAGDSPAFDMNQIDPWDSLMLIFKASAVHSVNVSVLDVNRKDGWDSLKEHAGAIIEALLGKASKLIPSLPAAVADTLGGASDDVKAFALKKLAGGDKVLFKRSAALSAVAPPQEFQQTISGKGTAGNYKLTVSLKVIAGTATPVV